MGRKRSVEAAERAREAVKLRSSGHSYSEIAKRLGFNDGSAAFKAVQRELDRYVEESVRELRMLQQLAYDELFRKLWAELHGKKGRLRLEVVDRLLKLHQMEAKLWGLYTYAHCPKCHEVGRAGKVKVEVKIVSTGPDYPYLHQEKK